MRKVAVFFLSGLCGLFLLGCGGGSTVAEGYPKSSSTPLVTERTTSIELHGNVIGADEAKHDVILCFKNPGTDSISCELTVDGGTVYQVKIDEFEEVSPHSFLIYGWSDTNVKYKDFQNPDKEIEGLFRFNATSGLQNFVYTGDPAKGEVNLNPKINHLYYLVNDNERNYVSFEKLKVTEGTAP